LDAGDAPLDGLETLEDVVEARPDRCRALHRVQSERTDGADDLASSVGEQQLEATHTSVEPIDLAAQDRRNDVRDASLHVTRKGLRLSEQSLTAA
jgi:hypothetical protein